MPILPCHYCGDPVNTEHAHAMPHRWRLTHNDDTDICLQALTSGWSTLLVNAFLAKKITTMVVKGGNTDDLYADAGSDARDTYGRYEMTRMLERAWPGVVKMVRQYGRYTHSVNWGAFTDPPRLRPGVEVEPGQIPATAMSIAETVTEDWPEGWGWDSIDVNRVLHCPEHRSAANGANADPRP